MSGRGTAGGPERCRRGRARDRIDVDGRSVEAPDHRLAGRRDGEGWFYLEGAGPSRFLTVVVVFDGREGIITAFGRRSMQ